MHEIFAFCPFSFLVKKNKSKNLIYFKKKKLLRFMKLVVLLLGVFSQFMSEVPRLPFFCPKKQLKNHDVLYRKSVTFCKNCRFFLLVFLQICLKCHLCPFVVKNNKKNTMYPSKNRNVCEIVIFLQRVFSDIV